MNVERQYVKSSIFRKTNLEGSNFRKINLKGSNLGIEKIEVKHSEGSNFRIRNLEVKNSEGSNFRKKTNSDLHTKCTYYSARVKENKKQRGVRVSRQLTLDCILSTFWTFDILIFWRLAFDILNIRYFELSTFTLKISKR